MQAVESINDPEVSQVERRVGEEAATLIRVDSCRRSGPCGLKQCSSATGNLQVGQSGRWTVRATVTERGEAIGLVELTGDAWTVCQVLDGGWTAQYSDPCAAALL